MNFSKEAEEFNEEMRVPVKFVVVFIGLLSILGLLGNCIVIFVYTRKYPKCNFKHFVLVLAGIDLVSCLVVMPLEMYTMLHWFVFEYSWLCKTKSFLNVFTVTSSAATLLLIAIDRFRKVCRPHSAQIQPLMAVKLTILVLAISVIPSTSDALFWGIHNHTYHNMTLQMCEKDDLFKDTIFPKLHVIILYAGLNIVAMISTLVLYSIIAAKMFCTSPFTSLGNRPPAIKITTPVSEDSGGFSTPGTRPSPFTFPADTGIESGISDSEDFDASVNLSDSQGNITDDEVLSSPKVLAVSQLSVNDNTEQLEMVPLRNKSPQTTKPGVRISIDIDGEAGKRTSLQLPGPEMRKVPRSPRLSRTFKNESKEKDVVVSRSYNRRRSTIASLTGRSSTRLRKKTQIMFILTAVFVVTTVLYFCLIAVMAEEGTFVTSLTAEERTVWLFFLRFYFINSVINPVLYGFLDPRFRKALWNMGVRVGFLAGSVKRSLGNSLRGHTNERITHDVSSARHTTYPRPILKSRSSITD